jgi:hypothetical protein
MDPLLDPADLQDNGGLTQTIRLLPGSPAINAGDNTVCSAAVGSSDFGAGGLDQRGVARPSGARCDPGAYEATLLAVLSAGTGNGMMIGSGFNCTSFANATSGDCLESVAGVNTIVALSAKPTAGSVFSGWSGDPDCTDGEVTMNTNKTCIATFNLLPQGVDLAGQFTKLALKCKQSSNKFELSIQNLGTLASSKAFPFSVNYFLSDDATLDGADTLLATLTLSKAIKAGKVASLSGKFKLTSCPQGKQLLAQIDPTNALAEVNETNNFVASVPLIAPASEEWRVKALSSVESVSAFSVPSDGARWTQVDFCKRSI